MDNLQLVNMNTPNEIACDMCGALVRGDDDALSTHPCTASTSVIGTRSHVSLRPLTLLTSPPLSAQNLHKNKSKRKSDSAGEEQHSSILKRFALSESPGGGGGEHVTTGSTALLSPVDDSLLSCPSGRDTPNEETSRWIDNYHALTRTDRIDALSMLVASCSLNEVRHLSDLIEPYFKKDFVRLLPKEIAIHVLGFLSASDLRACARVSRVWRTISEDHKLWREQCREEGIVSDLLPPATHYGSCHARSAYKSIYMRHQSVKLNWRCRQTPLERNRIDIRTHDEHVITCLQVSDEHIVSGSDDNTLRVFDASTGQLLHVLSGHHGGVWSSQLSTQLGLVISGSTDRTVRVWSLATGECRRVLTGHTSTVRCMALHGHTLITGSRDSTLRAWNVLTGDCIHVLHGHGTAVRCVAFDGERIVSGSYDSTLRVWHMASEACVHVLHGHLNRVYTLILAKDRPVVVSGSLDTTIRVWDINDGRMLHVLIGHQSLTSGMSLYNDLLVSGNADSTVRVWNIRDGQNVYTLAGPHKHESAVTSLALLPHAGLLVTSSDDGTAKLWDVNQGTFVRDLIRLPTGGQRGGCIWRLKATPSRLVCAVGSRNNVEDTKLIIVDFGVEYP